MKDSTKDGIKLAVSLLLVAAATVVAFVFGTMQLVRSNVDAPTEEESETAPGMPLDAIQYAAPSWAPNARQCFRVTDRQSGASWWVIQDGNGGEWQWLVLPIEGKVQNIG